MDENRGRDAGGPEWFVNTATAPRWLGTVGAVIITALGLFGAWATASDPILGLGLGHPVTLATGGIIVCVGVGLVVFVWQQSDAAWRRVPDGPLSPDVRALADAGRKQEAIDRLRAETGAGGCEAWQVIEKYSADRQNSRA